MSKHQTQLLGANMEVELVKKLKLKLVREGLTYREWLKIQVAQYICKRRTGKRKESRK